MRGLSLLRTVKIPLAWATSDRLCVPRDIYVATVSSWLIRTDTND